MLPNRKNYVFDTSTLMHDPKSIFNFNGNNVYVPLMVLEELDNLKNKDGIQGFQAREALRNLNATIDGLGDLAISTGIPLDNDIRLFIYVNEQSEQHTAPNRNYILQATKKISLLNDNPTTLVTKNLYLRINGKAMGLSCEDYETDKIVSNLYSGYDTMQISEKKLDRIFDSGLKLTDEHNLHPNQFVFVQSKENERHKSIARLEDSRLVPLQHDNKTAWGLRPINAEQKMAFELLMNPDIPFVSITGGAGCGKTIVATAVALEKVLEQKEYRKIVFVRPVSPAGDNIGYLPGNEEEKLRPWMGSFYDAIENLMNLEPKAKKNKNLDNNLQADCFIEDLHRRGIIETKTFTYMRGRTLSDAFVIVDEAQEITPHLAKLMLTRAGNNTKFVLIGDPSDNQIDNAMVDSRSNGLVYTVEKLKSSPLTGHVTLNQVERSQLASLAESVL